MQTGRQIESNYSLLTKIKFSTTKAVFGYSYKLLLLNYKLN